MIVNRRWDSLSSELEARFSSDAFGSRTPMERLEPFLELAWAHLQDSSVSWMGFYLDHPDEPEDRRLHLGPSRGGPVCNPIGLHGACGQALLSGRALVVGDVAELGEAYIACDPRDRSELVVPLLQGRQVVGVLDLDSHQEDAFDGGDAQGLAKALLVSGISTSAASL